MEPKKKNIRTSDRVARLANYCKNNIGTWLSRTDLNNKYISSIEDEEERKEAIKELELAILEYETLKNRDLTQKQKELLRSVNVSERYGVSDKVEYISTKYCIKKSLILRIIRDFNGLDNFKEQFIQYIIKRENVANSKLLEDYIKELDGKIVIAFDLTSPDLINRKQEYLKIDESLKYQIFDATKLELQLKKVLSQESDYFSPNERMVLTLFYGIQGEKISRTEIAKKMGISYQRVSQILKNAKQKYHKLNKKNKFSLVADEELREEFIEEFYKKHDIFYNEECEMDKETLEKLKQIALRKKFKDSQVIPEYYFNSQGLDERTNKKRIVNSKLRQIYYKDVAQTIRKKLIKSLDIVPEKRKELKFKQLPNINDEIEKMDFPKGIKARLCNGLRRLGINTVYDLILLDDTMLTELIEKNHTYMGNKSISAIQEARQKIYAQMPKASEKIEAKIENLKKQIISMPTKDLVQYIKTIDIDSTPIDEIAFSQAELTVEEREKIKTIGDLKKDGFRKLQYLKKHHPEYYNKLMEKLYFLGYSLTFEENITNEETFFDLEETGIDCKNIIQEELNERRVLVKDANLSSDLKIFLQIQGIDNLDILTNMTQDELEQICGSRTKKIKEEVHLLGYNFVDENPNNRTAFILQLAIEELQELYRSCDEEIKKQNEEIEKYEKLIQEIDLTEEEIQKQLDSIEKMISEYEEFNQVDGYSEYGITGGMQVGYEMRDKKKSLIDTQQEQKSKFEEKVKKIIEDKKEKEKKRDEIQEQLDEFLRNI